MLLDVHWLTDVIAGLALGWAWFAVCSIAFGGRILRFGAGAELAARAAASILPGAESIRGIRAGWSRVRSVGSDRTNSGRRFTRAARARLSGFGQLHSNG